MDQTQRDYVLAFLAYAGVKKCKLAEDDLQFVFNSLTCCGQEAMDADGIHGWDIHLGHKLKWDYHVPMVDQQLELWSNEGKLEVDTSCRWPNGKSFAVCLTHDVDSIRKPTCWDRLRCLPTFLRQAPLRETAILLMSAAKQALLFFENRDLNLEAWVSAEAKYGFSSSFFFLPAPIPSPQWTDNIYSYSDVISIGGKRMYVHDFMKSLIERGFDVGLHGSHHCAIDPQICLSSLKTLASAMGQAPITNRQHHLFYDVVKSPKVFSECGLGVDSSVGSNKDTLFRSLTAMPYFLFDRQNEVSTDVLEVPLIIQDYALFAPRSLNLGRREALDHSKGIIDRIAAVNGVGAVLWHPDYGTTGDHFSVYKDLLRYIFEKGGWACSARDLRQWWLRPEKKVAKL